MRSLNIPRLLVNSHSLEERSSESNKAKKKVDAMEVLFEYRGSRRQLTASNGENLIECVTTELRRIGRSRAQVYTANVDLSTVDRNREVYLLQKWSPQWECYLDVNQASEISDGDRLAVVIKPKPPSKFLLLCCCCSGVQNQPQVQGIPRSKKNAVRKNEEIQALDYMFNVESGRESRASEMEQTQTPEPSEAEETDLNEGEKYVRAESGRASWKLVPTKSSDDLAEDTEQQPAASDSAEPADTQEQELENNSTPPHPSETVADATEPVEGNSEQATDTAQLEEGGEQPATNEPGENTGEKEMVTEDKSAEDNSSDNPPADNTESNAPAVEEKADHKDTTNGESMPTEKNESGETAEPSREEGTTVEEEARDETQQESLNDNETKASDEAQATIEPSTNN